ncbi:hypothetical protein [Streptomyces sp. SS]|uniref:hypothetical protein n=1 Tax=Streptomyces sp. SS TaxID=260742 RepID=UPI0002EB836A|nr:hypothetical protein [Streptomyces sp. SS]
MEPELNPQPPHPAELELMKVRAGMAAGLTFEQSARLQGSTVEELTADAQTLAAELNATNQAPPAPRSGGSRGPDVGSGGRGVSDGAALYRARHNLDEAGQRPAKKPIPTGNRNPFAEAGYTLER